MWVKRQQTLSYFSESFSAGFVPLYSLIYVGINSYVWSDNEFMTLLANASEKLDEMGISGFLLHYNGAFLHILEGPEESVHKLYSVISLDSRHLGVTTLVEEYIPDRNFPEFSMGYHRLTQDDLRALDPVALIDDAKAFVDYFQRAPEKALPLALSFRQS